MSKISEQAIPFFGTRRIDGLNDGVFAIVMTLLVLEFNVPHLAEGEVLFEALLLQWPTFFGYVVTFINLGVFWIGQSSQYHFLERSDRIVLWMNVLFLLFVSLLPFTTAIISHYPMETLSHLLYGANLMAVTFVGLIHWTYATHHHRLTNHLVTKHIARAMRNRMLTLFPVCMVAMITAYFAPLASLAIYLILPVYFMLPRKSDIFWKHPAIPHTH